MDKNKNKKTYTKAELIANVARRVRVRRTLVKKIYEGLEQEIMHLLAQANIDEDICLHLFEGISIDSTFLPEKEKINNLTGEKITTLEKIKAKASITKNYCKKLFNYEEPKDIQE